MIGHEMGHVLHRHSQKRQVKKQLFGTVLNAIVYEDHDGYDETFGEAVSEILLRGASWLGEQSFSRRDEYEADATAWRYWLNPKNTIPEQFRKCLESCGASRVERA